MYPAHTCVPCLQGLVQQAARLATPDRQCQQKAIFRGNQIINELFQQYKNPAKVASIFHQEIKEITGNEDPFSAWKQREIDLAEKLFSQVKNRFKKNFLAPVLQLSVLGNSLDFFCSEEDLEEAARDQVSFAFNDIGRFESMLEHANRILLLADNAGEVFFDLPLYQYLISIGKQVVYVVKGRAVQNDMTFADLDYSGLRQQFDRVVSNQSAVVGFQAELAGTAFQKLYRQADLIIAKGMGHWETLGEESDPRLFFLFKAKCLPIADQLGLAKGSYLFLYSPNTRALPLEARQYG